MTPATNGPSLSNLKMLVLAGGEGTRLLSRVSRAPKALAPVNERVFLDYLLSTFYKQGIRQFDLSLGHKSDQVISWLKQAKLPPDLVVRYAIEPAPLGTGGAIAFCRNFFGYDDDILVCNGDTYLENGLAELLRDNSGLNIMATLSVSDISQFGSVETDENLLVTKFNEKSGLKAPGIVNAGLYLLRKEFLSTMPGGRFSLEKELFYNLVSQNKLQSVFLNGLFIDIGTPDNYDKFIHLVESKKVNEPWT